MGFILSWVGMLLVFLAFQLVVSFKFKNILMRLIPAMIIALSYIFAFVLYLGGALGLFPEGGQFAGGFIMLFSSADLLGCLLGWLLYFIVCKSKEKKSKSQN